MILKILLGILWLVVIPFGLGIFPCRLLQKKYRSPGMIFVAGYLIMMALFECEYLPALFMGMKFTTLCMIFRISVGFLSLASTILGAKNLKDLSYPKWNAFMIIFVVMVGLQCVARWFQGVTDGDDAYFLGTAVTTYFSNTMYKFDPYTGLLTGMDVRHALSPGGVFIAYLSNCMKVHPAITAHIIFADIALILHYIVFYNIGKVLLEDKEKFISLFACFVCVFDVYGAVSLYTPAIFLLTRTWQGKSVIANLCIPFAFLILLLFVRKEETGKQYKHKLAFYSIMTVCVTLAAMAMATTGLMLMPVILFIGAVVTAIYRRKISVLLVTMASLVPIGALGALFMILR
jgi:hypothetical protein